MDACNMDACACVLVVVVVCEHDDVCEKHERMVSFEFASLQT